VRKAAPLPHEFYVALWAFISRKVAACIFKRVSGSSAGSNQFIFEVGVFKKPFYLRTDDNATDVVAVSQSQSPLQCSTPSSYKITLSRPFVEGSTADTVIQVAEPRLWGVPVWTRSFISASVINWLCGNVCWKILVFPCTWPSFWWSLLHILFLSPEYNFLVAPVLALSRHEWRVSMQKVYWGILLCVHIFQRSHWC
jgi:hypothetical protein